MLTCLYLLMRAGSDSGMQQVDVRSKTRDGITRIESTDYVDTFALSI